ncbi:MFS transporter [Paenibacillus beijingensis]|uniref:Fosmidomycin resistance protein n=1 Tax=Paenibacillus beijingensis TaxID=1126833 RepID=A0A0D5NFU0_9BACL|nr:MFS transporter [Paenibacillus beijingensis]AJY74020.1 Fosmidomycin resistance protein [Paenibacillus beijingensis]
MSSLQSARIGAVRTGAVYFILIAISAVHMLNDSMQSVVTALFPVLEKALDLNFTQVGWIAFTLNMTSSVMQPAIGIISDKRPAPWMLPAGMGCSLIGMAGLAFAPNFPAVIASVVFVGLGSAVFHPEGSRVVYFAAGARRGLAQSIYQVGGNFGQSLGPLMTMFIFIPLGQHGAVFGTLLAAAAIVVLLKVVPWYSEQLKENGKPAKKKPAAGAAAASGQLQSGRNTVAFALGLLILLVFVRSWYGAAIGSFHQFYMMDHYGLSTKLAQVPLYLFMVAGVAGTFFGGMLADRFGRKNMMFWSVAGSAPFALLLPHLPLYWVYPTAAVLGFVLMSGFSVSVVYAQELMPGKVGMASGLITGFAFGMGALGAVVLGTLADRYGLASVMTWCSFLPLVGVLAILLPKDRRE